MTLSFSKYLEHSLSRYKELNYNGQPDLIVIIPAFNEPDIFRTFESLLATKANNKILIIVVVNYSEMAPDHVKQFNQDLFDIIDRWGVDHSTDYITFKALLVRDVRRKHAGAGYARKVGMDTATEVFVRTRNDKGLIVSLDADCEVDEDYFNAIYHFENDDKVPDVQVFDFEHQKENLADEQLNAMIQYELYLHYYVLGCRISGFPYAYHTIGSCFAVTVDAYVRNGGMNRKHAGEDFYFLHKLFPNSVVERNYNTVVSPAARISDRVPFGTGPALKEIIEKQKNLDVYNPIAFNDLKQLFGVFPHFYNDFSAETHGFSEVMMKFLAKINFKEKVLESKSNSSNALKFEKRLFRHFDAFQIVKFLNFAHDNGFYKKIPIELACKVLLGDQLPDNKMELLKKMREMERNTNLRQLG